MTDLEQPDEREGLPSASSAGIFYHCPGAPAMWKTAPKQKETSVASRGTAMHAALETGDTEDLDVNEQIVVDKLGQEGMEKQALDKWMVDIDSLYAPRPGAIREKRYWIRDLRQSDFPKLASAKLDVHWIAIERNAALALDFKTGYLEVTEAAQNEQTRIQALCLWHENRFLTKIRVGIAQRMGGITVADYDLEALEMSEKEFLWHDWMSKQPHAPRIPGTHCHYCPAKSNCIEAICYGLVVSVMKSKSGLADNHVRAMVWRRKSLTTWIFEEVEEALKALTPEELAELGLYLKPNDPTPVLGEPNQVYGVLSERGLIDAQGFHSCCKVLKGKVEKVIIPILRATGLKADDAKAKLAEILKPVSDMKPRNPSLKEIGTTE